MLGQTAPPTQPAPRPVLEPGSDAFRKLLQTSYLQYADGKLPEKAEGPVQNPDSDTETDSEHDVQVCSTDCGSLSFNDLTKN